MPHTVCACVKHANFLFSIDGIAKSESSLRRPKVHSPQENVCSEVGVSNISPECAEISHVLVQLVSSKGKEFRYVPVCQRC